MHVAGEVALAHEAGRSRNLRDRLLVNAQQELRALDAPAHSILELPFSPSDP